jgi:hypothetical protein
MTDSNDQSQKRTRGGQKGNTNPAIHGVYALMRWRRRHGLPDGRTVFGRNFREREKEYKDALGGDLSPMLATLVEDTVWQDFYVATCDQYLSQLKQFIRKGKAHPLVEVRVKLSNSRRENLKLMGFKRAAKEVESLENYIQRKYSHDRADDAGENVENDAPDDRKDTNDAGEDHEQG